VLFRSINDLKNYLEFLIKKGKKYIQNEGKKSWEWMRKYWNHLDILKEIEDIYDKEFK
jgi:hypothetical protein